MSHSHSHQHGHNHGDCEYNEHHIQDGIHICTHNIEPLINLQSNELLDRCVGNVWRTAITLKLYLYAERIGSLGCAPLADSLNKNTQLQNLLIDLSNNNIGSNGCKALGQGLSQIVNLRKLSLNLYKNGIQDDGFISMITSLSEAPQLIELELFFYFTINQILILYQHRSNELKLAYNLHKLKKALSQFQALTKLKLSMSQIDQKDEHKIKVFFIKQLARSNVVILNIKM